MPFCAPAVEGKITTYTIAFEDFFYFISIYIISFRRKLLSWHHNAFLYINSLLAEYLCMLLCRLHISAAIF